MLMMLSELLKGFMILAFMYVLIRISIRKLETLERGDDDGRR